MKGGNMIATRLFETISLKEMDQVRLMNRNDYKYWFHIQYLDEILEEVKDQYFVLSIKDESIINYKTTYYDTPLKSLFMAHHNGRLHRYKIRKRAYVSSGISFLEIKNKSNKGKTFKSRMATTIGHLDFNPLEKEFLSAQSPVNVDELQVSLSNEFNRITLVSKQFDERCTIDVQLSFRGDSHEKQISDLVIIEIKTEGNTKESPLALALRNHRIKAAGFSKYCMGMTLTSTVLKKNAFKPKIRRMEQVLQSKINE